jgi:Beta-propeller repeat
MTKVTLFGIRGLCGALAVALFLGLAHPALTADQPQWVQQLGTSEYDTASGVGTDADGNVCIAGYSGGRFGSDAWVAKYSAAGHALGGKLQRPTLSSVT